MKIIPYEKVHLVTDFSAQQVFDILTSNTQPVKLIRFGRAKEKDSKIFEGSVGKEHFKIQRVIQYRNSFLPQISGQISGKFNKTHVFLKFHPHTIVLVFMTVWFIGIFIGLTAILMIGAKDRAYLIYSLAPLSMIVFGFLMVNFGFAFESKKAKEALINLLKASVQERI